MSGPSSQPSQRTVLFCLHFLGGSEREWLQVEARLRGALDCVTIDLDGFGDAAHRTGYSVRAMADRVAGLVGARAPSRWLLAGHSMGAKVAAVLARRAEDGEAGLAGLAGLVLLAGSPPSPEPMQEALRQTMIGWFDGEASHDQAQGYITQNVGAALDEATNRQAVEDVLRAHRGAWVAWLEGGSREDWSEHVGRLRAPTLILAGEKDAALGPEAQRALAARHFERARVVVLAGAGHLLPMERPDEVARLIAAHAGCLPGVGEAYGRLLFSDRTSARTRQVLLERGAPDGAEAAPSALAPELFEVLRALLDRVLPQDASGRAGPPVDLARRVDALLASGPGDGWRYDLLPSDLACYRAGLRTLDLMARARHRRGFADLDADTRDAMLHAVAEGVAGGAALDALPLDAPLLDASRMRRWFEDVRADAVKLYVSHPATLSRMGYSGTFYGGDDARKPGFVRVGPGEREPWEPEPCEPGPVAEPAR